MIRQVTYLVRNSGEIPWVSVRSFLLFRVAFVQGKDEVSWEEKCIVWTPALPRSFLASCIPWCCSDPNLSSHFQENCGPQRLRIRLIKCLLNADKCSFTDKETETQGGSRQTWDPNLMGFQPSLLSLLGEPGLTQRGSWPGLPWDSLGKHRWPTGLVNGRTYLGFFCCYC